MVLVKEEEMGEREVVGEVMVEQEEREVVRVGIWGWRWIWRWRRWRGSIRVER